MKPTRYLVQLHDNSLHGYDREDLLRCDLASNKDCPPKRIFRLCETSVTIRYDVIDITEIAPSLSGSIPSIPVITQLAA